MGDKSSFLAKSIVNVQRKVADRKISDDFALDACSGKFMDLKISSQ